MMMSAKGRLAHALRRVLEGAAGMPGEPPPLRGGKGGGLGGGRKRREGEERRGGKYIPVIPAGQGGVIPFCFIYIFFY